MSFSILSTYPNPFNPTTTIRFNIAVETFGGTSLLQIFDITGRVVETLVNENLVPGEHDVVWDANNQVSGIGFWTKQIRSKIGFAKVNFLSYCLTLC